MDVTVDEGRGRAIGSRIVLAGHAFGLRLRLDEAIVERTPPASKSWATLGEPRLLVIGAYRMGFVIEPHGRDCGLRVVIDYALPPRGLPRWLGRAFGAAYARWCTRALVADAVAHFA